MANFIEYASKAQEELNHELQILSDKERDLAKQSSLQASRSASLDARESAVAEQERLINQKREELSMWDSKKMREEEVVRLHDEALRMEEDSKKRDKEATDKLLETKQNLVELTKRELALSEREKTYEEELKKKMMDSFLRVK